MTRVTFWIVMLAIAGTMLLGYFIVKRRTEERLWSVGFKNYAGTVPGFRCRYRRLGQPQQRVWIFKNSGLPIKTWVECREKIEAALNITIIQVAYCGGKRYVRVTALPGNVRLPGYLAWKEDLLSSEDFELVLGESLLGRVTINLSNPPHLMLGGCSGSGKSALLKLLLMQSLHKGAEVYIADFKGGVDFPREWWDCCRIITEKAELLSCLSSIDEEMERRRHLLAAYGCTKIEEYNARAEQKLPRIIVACDEVTDILDKRGLLKDERFLTEQLESKISRLARQGRAFGIHLVLATQRPDADLISGQIRSNLGYRICGQADEILSKIVLENTVAAEQISPDDRGRFVLRDTVFQAYWMDDSQLEN